MAPSVALQDLAFVARAVLASSRCRPIRAAHAPSPVEIMKDPAYAVGFARLGQRRLASMIAALGDADGRKLLEEGRGIHQGGL